MEHKTSSTERSPFARLESVCKADVDLLADMFLDAPSVDERRESDDVAIGSRLDIVLAEHLSDASEAVEQFCAFCSSDAQHPVGCVQHVDTGGWSAWIHGQQIRLGQQRATIRTAVSDVARRCERVLVLLPRQDEIGRLIAGLEGLTDPPDSIIILSTTSDSDVVASYRQAKSIAAFAPAQLSRLIFAVVGDDDDAARSVLTRLQDTADRFLHAPIRGMCCISHQPEPAEVSTHGPIDPTIEPPLQSRLNGVESHEADEPGSDPTLEPVVDEDPLDRLVLLVPHVERVRLTCPDSGPVAFGIDGKGRLHAIAGAFEHADWSDVHNTHPERALVLAEAYLARHIPVLGLIDRRLEAVSACDVQLHLVSDRYPALAALLGGRLRLHLAVPVSVDERTHWGASELAV